MEGTLASGTERASRYFWQQSFPDPPIDAVGINRDIAFRSTIMLGYAITFFIIALIAGALGFGVIGGTAMTIGKVLAVVFLILAVVSLLRGRSVSV